MKNKIVLTICLLLSIIIVASFSYAYFRTRNSETLGSVSITTKELNMLFTDGQGINISNMIPGSTYTKTFSVENISDETLTYSVNFIDVINTFKRKYDITIDITSDNSGGSISNKVFPSLNNTIISNITINSGVTQTYNVVITYDNALENQVEDVGENITAKIDIGSPVTIKPCFFI